MKKLLLACLLVLCACAAPSDEVQTISAQEAHEMMEGDVIILDVRTKEEYQDAHIPNSINVALDDIEELIETKIADKSKTVLVYCRSGNRSRQASSKLVKLGYEHVYDFGGINDWPYETES